MNSVLLNTAPPEYRGERLSSSRAILSLPPLLAPSGANLGQAESFAVTLAACGPNAPELAVVVVNACFSNEKGSLSVADSEPFEERVKGIEPSPKAWEAFVLPLNYTRNEWSHREDYSPQMREALWGRDFKLQGSLRDSNHQSYLICPIGLVWCCAAGAQQIEPFRIHTHLRACDTIWNRLLPPLGTSTERSNHVELVRKKTQFL